MRHGNGCRIGVSRISADDCPSENIGIWKMDTCQRDARGSLSRCLRCPANAGVCVFRGQKPQQEFPLNSLKNQTGSSEFLVEILTTECSETPSATLKAAIEQRSAKYQPPCIRLPEDYKTRRRMSTLGYAQKFTRRPSLKLVAFR